MKNFQIKEIMKKHHLQLINFLERFKKIKDDNSLARKVSFDLFKWELEKHFFTEERAIFLFYHPEKESDKEEITQLLKEHEIILEKLDELYEKVESNELFNFQELEDLLLKHKEQEDNFIYPKLDEILDDEIKKIIINRISDQF
ncbi:MAG: hemerythrin domain-containing protein [Promethearchaeota archaeon]